MYSGGLESNKELENYDLRIKNKLLDVGMLLLKIIKPALFTLFTLAFFATETHAQVEIPCRYPLQVSADSLVNFVRKDFEWRTGKPTQIEP